MVDVGLGQKMHILCKGHGKPAGNYFAIIVLVNSILMLLGFTLISVSVILDSPAGMSSDVWIYVQENVAKITKVRKTQVQTLNSCIFNYQYFFHKLFFKKELFYRAF